eukprot:811205-Amphidinium_carterae.1
MGGGRKGKGAPAPAPVDPEAEYRIRITEALPSAARLRAYPKVLGTWSVPVLPHTQLGPAGGITYVRKTDVPMVLAKVGSTMAPCAM